MQRERILEVMTEFNCAHTSRTVRPLCTYNPGSTCAGVMQAGNGICCRDMDTSDRIRHLHARYQESLQDSPF